VQATGRGHVRIIAGTLRGSKLPVAALEGLRPTSDRARETLFNWLQNGIAGRKALDLFAGSGALGFEAVSRGAGQVVMVERNPTAFSGLLESRNRLKTENVELVHADALAWLPAQHSQRFDLVFLDPPFAGDIWHALWPLLMPVLADTATLYLELPVDRETAWPAGISQLKHSKTRQSRQLLLQWQKPLIG
jgi:16S rRNA (guanine966-N2)-methyltransferase